MQWFLCRSLVVTMAVLLTAATPARAQSLLAEYVGTYVCGQGLTRLSVRIVSTSSPAYPNAKFIFGPDVSNPDVPNGSYWAKAYFTGSQELSLVPIAWITQPTNYVMVGLQGTSFDGGNSFTGSIVGGTGCTMFTIQRVSGSVVARGNPVNPAAPAPEARDEVPLVNRGGVFVVPVAINNMLTLNFMIDSGASDVLIPADVVMTLIRGGTIRAEDFLGGSQYRLADGSVVPSPTFRIRTLKVGTREVHDVTGSVGPVSGSLLLGQSFLRHFSSRSINNRRQVLVLE